MNEAIVYPANKVSVAYKTNKARLRWLFLFTGILLFSLALSFLMVRSGPDVRMIAWIIYFAGIAVIFYQPRWSIYLILFFSLIGDSLLVVWYPFTKNFSSAESIFFVSKSFIFSPLETYLVFALISWLGRGIQKKKFTFYKGELTFPSVFFMVFIVFGLVYGLASKGDLTIALWEVRPFFYLFIMLILSTNLFTRKEHYHHFFMWAAVAIIIKSIIGTVHIFTQMGGHLASVDGITEHSAAIHINTVIVMILVAWLYRASPMKRFGLLIGVPFLALTYIAAQRRAAFVSIMVALILLAFLLFFENRRLFWALVPAVSAFAVIYLVMFWNSTGGTLGMPAQALKSAISPNSISLRNQLSNAYRLIENVDTSFTVHQKPLTGVGFGNKFYVPVPLPDISFFVWWNYFPHNSIIYLWVKTGVGGFLAMLYFIGISILTGVRVVRRARDREIKVFLVTGVLYIVMHFMYAYVDISWDAQSMLYLGAVLGMLNSAESIISIPASLTTKRFPWQPEESTQPGLLP